MSASRAAGEPVAPEGRGRPGRPVRMVDPGYPPDWRVRLATETLKIRRARQVQEQLVAQALAAGATWSAIAGALGVSRQSAHRRFRHLEHAQVGQAE